MPYEITARTCTHRPFRRRRRGNHEPLERRPRAARGGARTARRRRVLRHQKARAGAGRLRLAARRGALLAQRRPLGLVRHEPRKGKHAHGRGARARERRRRQDLGRRAGGGQGRKRTGIQPRRAGFARRRSLVLRRRDLEQVREHADVRVHARRSARTLDRTRRGDWGRVLADAGPREDGGRELAHGRTPGDTATGHVPP